MSAAAPTAKPARSHGRARVGRSRARTHVQSESATPSAAHTCEYDGTSVAKWVSVVPKATAIMARAH